MLRNLNLRHLSDRLSRDVVTVRTVSSRCPAGRRVEAMVAGRPVWFESDGPALRVDAFPFVAAFLPGALNQGRGIQVDQAIDPHRLRNLPRIVELLDRWWSYGTDFTLKPGRSETCAAPAGRRTGLFFSCGVDSFHSLFEKDREIDDLILIHGFDIPLTDAARFAALRREAGEVAESMGKRLITVRTNLRSHRIFRRGGWVRNHGAALAAVAHLLAGEIGRIYVSASYPGPGLRPWGSHPLLDHLWSDGFLDFRHIGDDVWRFEKVRRHGGNPLFRDHLVVCWKGRGLPSNCGICEKCVRNRLALEGAGHETRSFPDAPALPDAIRMAGRLNTSSTSYREALESPRVGEATKEALRGALEAADTANTTEAGEGTRGWTVSELKARVMDFEGRRRFPAGSPDEQEVAAYVDFFPASGDRSSKAALVLGMTPELRRIAAGHFGRSLAVDRSAAAIELFADWLPEALRAKERIYAFDWESLPYMDVRDHPEVQVVMGDGVFANLPDMEAHRRLLAILTRTFPAATLIFRKIMAVEESEREEFSILSLRDKLRRGQIDENAFGLTARFQGFLDRHYDKVGARLDNASIFSECDRMHASGLLDDRELEAIRRFAFGGFNTLPTRASWEGLLDSMGYSYRVARLEGQLWYSYYQVYQLAPGPPSSTLFS